MAVTFNFELNNRASKNKTYAVLLRITQNKSIKELKPLFQSVEKQTLTRMPNREIG